VDNAISSVTGGPISNPVVPGFHPDPSVCRVGEDYYLACSSFEYFPGIPLFHSRDLVSWTQIGNALDRPSQLDLLATHSSGGVYAPTLRHHGGRFWITTTSMSTRGHLIVSAPDPAGPWSDPAVVPLPGIDPDLCWDDDGACWFTYTASPGDGEPSRIMQARIDPSNGDVIGAPRTLWEGTGLAYPEAPHMFRAQGLWYLVIAEGGTERGHAVSVARGPHPRGPFEGCPRNPVLSHRSTASPIQNTGHADFIETPDGAWFAVLLGTRPRGGTPGFHVLGRETFLTPVQWSGDGWPIPDPVLDGADPADTRVRDEFDGKRLAPAWVSLRRPPTQVADLAARPGWLTLTGSDQTLDQPLATFVGVRQQHLRFGVKALIDASTGVGGLVLRIDEGHYYSLEVGAEGGRVRCIARIGPLRQEVGAYATDGIEGMDTAGGAATTNAADSTDSNVILCIEAVPALEGFLSPGAAPDVIRLGIERDGERIVLGELDGRYLSTEVAGGFTGRMIGMYAQSGTVAFDWFEYTGNQEKED
jgi:xylan 1,4-beta-xylosidase